ncbi:UDP-N-acetylmuramoyl-L-alanyl-D-glutamate--2,6-diaminopimelate ligase [wastewater metagenome]|uniref:UDP-N-acetylmuramoyl-L-alanyl-D-glutamate--2, 6-diaminopimelate ligase n=2 Tax=unclassified sequences TaxID=12908 RepID=A0A5B8RBX5_9ZZZZ|nr:MULTISPECIES: UDP-N-acetylmuramoyl-L-alanyl-D-glutamate--2,6-diaminopimelate ligase [Arhodomonas]MCS4504709.1 UDP-N-acetylmuramoyl-L-alanyl-D-glutamate--2,6-diaminopimelate ligase [Arhodomonas aquaeolei]QEA04974.1 UDP-N-acetylmuramoyl-L-alanyl-D-glutamate--2,6-diaminopimelate ligase [uncultured organism]
MTERRLDGLLAPLGIDAPALALTDLALDSREVAEGGVFLAVRGAGGHGLAHLEDALARKPAAVLWDPEGAPDAYAVLERCERAGVAAIAVPGLGGSIGMLAARFFGGPGRRLRLVGVTGTDGKTSTTQFVAAALDRAGHPWASIGTLGWGRPGALRETRHTTPDVVGLQRRLAALVDDGVEGVAMEVSSHALDQDRTQGLDFEVAVLTNLSRDHLDYHGSDAAYAAAKARLFLDTEPAAAVLNLDDAFGRDMAARTGAAVIGYSLADAPGARIRARGVHAGDEGLAFTLDIDGDAVDVAVPVFGLFNVANLLATAGVLLALGEPAGSIAATLAACRPVPGRMQALGGGDRPLVIVDYAHTPAALEAALAASRQHCAGALWCVFGCGGDRDTGKRAPMGRAAAGLADHVILTSDNPRGEPPESIIDAIRAGLPAPDAARAIPDRGEAIRTAVAGAHAGDVVLVAGKGHEAYQIVGDEVRAFSDREAVEAALAAGEGPWSR